jgi:hypothetical protein
MKASRFSDAQKAFILKQGADGVPGGVPEHPLVPDACRCPRKVGGVAQILQRGSAARCHWQQAPDHADESR